MGTYCISWQEDRKTFQERRRPLVEYLVGLGAGARKDANAQERSGWALAARPRNSEGALTADRKSPDCRLVKSSRFWRWP